GLLHVARVVIPGPAQAGGAVARLLETAAVVVVAVAVRAPIRGQRPVAAISGDPFGVDAKREHRFGVGQQCLVGGEGEDPVFIGGGNVGHQCEGGGGPLVGLVVTGLFGRCGGVPHRRRRPVVDGIAGVV